MLNWVVLLLFVAWSMIGCWSGPRTLYQDPTQMAFDACAHIKTKNPQTMITCYLRFAKLYPYHSLHVRARFYAARLLEQMMLLADAEQAYQQIIKEAPNHPLIGHILTRYVHLFSKDKHKQIFLQLLNTQVADSQLAQSIRFELALLSTYQTTELDENILDWLFPLLQHPVEQTRHRALFLSAQAYHHLGEFQKALTLLNRIKDNYKTLLIPIETNSAYIDDAVFLMATIQKQLNQKEQVKKELYWIIEHPRYQQYQVRAKQWLDQINKKEPLL